MRKSSNQIRENSGYLMAALLSGLLTILPFLIVDYAPIMDIPQQTAQIPLFLNALENPGGDYEIQYLTPYALSYLILGFFYLIFPPLVAGKVTLAALALAWVLSLQAFAYRRNRSAVFALLAGLFVFNHALHMGAYSFILGFPLFLIWLMLVEQEEGAYSWKRVILIIGTSVLLLFTHLTWLAIALLYYGYNFLEALYKQGIQGVKGIFNRILPVLPGALLGLALYIHITQKQVLVFFSGISAWKRLTSPWILNAFLGVLRGHVETILLLLVLLFAGWTLYQNRKTRVLGLDFRMLGLALLFLGLTLFLPETNTVSISIASRFGAFVIIFLILALPGFRNKIPAYGVVLTSVVFLLFTAHCWKKTEINEHTGFAAVLEKLPQKPRVLGLNFAVQSAYFRGSPHMQMFAYAQVHRGGELNFSFAHFPQTLVTDKRRLNWTRGLEWDARRVKARDFSYFDHVIVNGLDKHHALLAAKKYLRPLTHKGRWRLYRVTGIPEPAECPGETPRLPGPLPLPFPGVDMGKELCF